MDTISEELHSFLIRLGKEPDGVSEKVEHYIMHLIRIIPPDDEKALKDYYGLFGNPVKSLCDIAHERKLSEETMRKIMETSLRKIAVSPEWQMIRQIIK